MRRALTRIVLPYGLGRTGVRFDLSGVPFDDLQAPGETTSSPRRLPQGIQLSPTRVDPDQAIGDSVRVRLDRIHKGRVKLGHCCALLHIESALLSGCLEAPRLGRALAAEHAHHSSLFRAVEPKAPSRRTPARGCTIGA